MTIHIYQQYTVHSSSRLYITYWLAVKLQFPMTVIRMAETRENMPQLLKMLPCLPGVPQSAQSSG